MSGFGVLDKAFSPDEFRRKGHDLIDQLADLLESSQSGEIDVTSAKSPDELYEFWKVDHSENAHDFFQRVIDHSIKVHHPHYIGHQVSAPAPLAALSNLATGFLNNGMGIYEMGEGATAIEKVVIDIFCNHLGYKDGDGVLTSGGTLANLTGLLAARAQYKDSHVWSEGTKEDYCIMVSEMAHYCVDRAVKIMGWGNQGIIKVPVNSHYSMDVSALEQLYSEAHREGRKVIAIVGSAPCTATGSYDDLNSIADFCDKHKVWFHIDGAHGGAAIFSNKYNHLMKGGERADSVVIDAHKMMLIPALTTALLFKNKGDSYQTFSQDAYYLWEGQRDKEWYNIAKRSFECTKVMMSVRIMSVVQEYGTVIFDQFVTRQYDLARSFAELIHNADDFELANLPDANIVCFRYLPSGIDADEMISKINKSIRKSIYENGKFYLVQTLLNGQIYLRVSLMSPKTTIADLENAMIEIRNTYLVIS